ncbi:Regulatory P domain of the subtilisin-like proprotein convertases and other proteases [Mesomycoplasma conjunctivae]|uniref:Peptidase S8/S53 domain-containing protein n=1 Tax=Mesomycoplasma conjunctivae (strain ATCC 25834 / NCTC 10147 / HRC/581) TaxID=572263 RepID=C5J710_MESCH|nr:S8 family serine peptidase [Mesomycoplasma conjunctivae]CAT05273.1 HYPOTHETICAL PROTEIN MCJ_005760 [Mesomycoplasma conjunctivae]VEU66503.1 Regulatory P domain of the subtilisin-like proprotein convertases and other proteases [Mesomycoplasma conjunctivae]
MKIKKVKWFFKLFTFATIATLSSTYIIFNVNSTNFRQTLTPLQSAFLDFKKTNNKVIIRNNSSLYSSSSINSSTQPTKDVRNSLKIFLDYSIPSAKSTIHEDDILFSKQNQYYMNLIKHKIYENDIVLSDFYLSRLSPIIWLEIEPKFLDKALKILNNLDFISLIIQDQRTTQPIKLQYKSVQNQTTNIRDQFLKLEKEIVDYNENNNKSSTKIGILETDMKLKLSDDDIKQAEIDKENITQYDFSEYNNLPLNRKKNLNNDHAILVSSIIGGKRGFASSSPIFLANISGLSDSAWWMKLFESLIIDKNFNVINHSYGFNLVLEELINLGSTDFFQNNDKKSSLKNVYGYYTDYIFYLDYLSRKYGVINIFAAGNGHNKDNSTNSNFVSGYITGNQSSINSIIVGSSYGSKDSFIPSYFSNRKLPNALASLLKPTIVAPGENIVDISKNYVSFNSGTSFSAPIVTGIIAKILDKYPQLNDRKNIISSIMSLITSSAIDSKLDWNKISNYSKKLDEKYNKISSSQVLTEYNKDSAYWNELLKGEETKSSGFKNATGAGLINYKNIEKAIKNLKTINVSPKNSDDTVYTTQEIKLKKGDRIKASLAWLFNAGIQKNLQNDKRFNNWYFKLFQFWYFAFSGNDILEFLNKTPDKVDAFSKQKNRLFSDYDLFLEYKQNGSEYLSII